jgi:hypothetical protein
LNMMVPFGQGEWVLLLIIVRVIFARFSRSSN